MISASRMPHPSAPSSRSIPDYRQRITAWGRSNFEESSYLGTTGSRQASQRCSNVRVVLFLYISLAEILVFSNGSYFFVNIENMEENGNVLIIKGL